MMQHKRIQVFGIVQGVGFRYFVERLAHKYNVYGTVQNVNNYVEVYAQGHDSELEYFIKAVTAGASPASKVTDYQIDTLALDETYDRFKVLY